MKKFLFLFLAIFLFAKDVNEILYKIDIQNDLSNKTKKENSGIVYVFTRNDLENLQVFHLRDILKLLPVSYNFNRYGIIDTFNPNTNIPFLSSTIKLFINNHEVTSGLYNSGIAILGDIDLKWVDHIEIYTQAPSFEISTEPSIVVIKLYTKNPKRDEGKNLFISKSNKGDFNYFEYAKNNLYSYFAADDDLSSYNNSKYKRHFLLNIQKEKFSFLLNAYFNNQDGFLGLSMSGYPDKSFIKTKTLNIGVDYKVSKNFKINSSISLNKNKTFYYKNPLLFIINKNIIKSVDVYSYDRVVDLNFIYKKNFDKNFFILGNKNRFKYFNYDKLRFNGSELPRYGNKHQNINTLFFQFSHFLKENSLVNFGYSFSFFNNEHVKNQKTKQIRLSNTYLKDNLTFKTSFSHIEYTLDPYLIDSIFVTKNILKPVKIDDIFEEIKYKNDFNYNLDFALGFFISKDYYFPNSKGLLYNLDKRMRELYLSFRYDLFYKPFSKFSFAYYFQRMANIPKVNIYRVHKIAIYNFNQFKKFNPFEELVIDKSEGTKFYYDLSLGVKYQKSDNLTFLLKGENLLNKAKKYNFLIINPYNKISFLSVPIIERRIYLGMEYSF